MIIRKTLKIILAVIYCLWTSCTPALAQTPRDSAAERSRAQKNSSPTDDQNSPGASPGSRVMLQDTGGKSGTQGIGREEREKANIVSGNSLSNLNNTSNFGMLWGVPLLIVMFSMAAIIRNRDKDNRSKVS
jgi:hypothetical protein